MSKLLKGILCLTIAVAFVAPALADDSFEYHGYARMGTGITEDFTTQGSAFKAPGADTKYRLGNEPNDCYIENILVKNWKGEGDEYAKLVFLGAWTTSQNNNWPGSSSSSISADDSATDIDGDGNNDSVVTSVSDASTGVVRQIYAEIGDMAWAPGVSFWVGERFYRRRDVHITDFYYRDNSGWGGGVEGIAVGPAKLNLAYIAQQGGDALADGDKAIGNQQLNTLDLIVDSIDLGFANLELEYAQMYLNNKDKADGTATEVPFSFFTNAFLDMKSFFGLAGNATIGLQYGKGYGQSLAANWAYSGTKAEGDAIKDAFKFRVLFTGVAQVTADLSIMPLVVYQYTDSGAEEDAVSTWLSVGFRAKQMLNKNFAIQLEYGMDYTTAEGAMSNGDDRKGQLHKVTVAPTLQLAPGFWTRPELRVYATYAKWTDDFKGSIGDEKSDQTNDYQFGLQAEAWW
jgi:maltoporin